MVKEALIVARERAFSRRGHLPGQILHLESSLDLFQRRDVPATLLPGQLEAHAPKQSLVAPTGEREVASVNKTHLKLHA
jgi:hypothetical protein